MLADKIIDDKVSLEDIAILNNIPLNIQIDLTNMCDSNCIFCFQGSNHHKSDEELSFNEITVLLDDLKDLGTFRIGFSGGEPLMRKDIFDILQYARKKGFEISMVSNGNLLDDYSVKRLMELNISSINFSIHSMNEDNHAFHFGTKSANPNKKLSYIKMLVASGVNVGISVTVTKYNIDELPRMYETFIEYGINSSRIAFNSLLPGEKEISDLIPSEEQENKLYNLNPELLYNFKFKHSGSRSYLCAAGRSTAAINYKGDVYPCSFLGFSAGNVKEHSFKEIWEKSKLLGMIRSFNKENFKKCFNCKYNRGCSMCLAKNLDETGNVFVPSTEFCNSTQKTYDTIKTLV